MENKDPMALLDSLSDVMEKASTRRAFLSNPWATLKHEANIDPPAPNEPFYALVNTLAEMSFEELTLIGRFGTGIRGVLGPARLLF